jgi:hypothetical protein
MKKHGELKI